MRSPGFKQMLFQQPSAEPWPTAEPLSGPPAARLMPSGRMAPVVDKPVIFVPPLRPSGRD